MLERVLSWLVLLAQSDAAKDAEIQCCDTTSPCCVETVSARR
jgi:hypothetical protein